MPLHGCPRRMRDEAVPQGYGLRRAFVNAAAALAAACIVALPAQAEPLGADPMTVLALGDSLTAGYGLDQADAFPAKLETALRDAGHAVTVINAGVSGDTSAGGRARLEWLLTPEIDAVIVELGANDGLRGLDPSETRANLEWILAALRQKGLPTLLSGMQAPPNLGQEYGRDFNAIYPDLAVRYGALLDPFYLEGVAADPALNQHDGIHPNAEGVAIIVKRLTPKVIELLAKANEK